ncbi:hypothetical protein PIB30_076039 [Stylosanthes scabra]|uniref:GRF-type domain-containing protein n=1 Tax=Stylosanthes scabra TaxID=79078 RepID=A0ABU6TT45_9FABA|nr:hypothetical protein [Stylosanthes scabra]
MDSEGGSSPTRRSGGGRRGDRSSSETQGLFAAKVGHERDGAAPMCHCGVYAVLYLSKTPNNLNRLFFGCPFFKTRMNHCKFFLWLDQHAAKLGRIAESKSVKEDEVDIDEHFWRLIVENRVSELERRIAYMEKKHSMKFLFVCVLALSMVVGLYFGSHR